MKKNLHSLLCSLMYLMMLPLVHAEAVLNEFQGHSTAFSSLKGKWVFINYWASWCKTCVDEIPELNRFYQQHQKDPVALYAVNFDALPLNTQKNLIKHLNIHYPSLTRDPSEDLHLGDITGVPVTFVFNPQGLLVDTLYGGQSAGSLNKIIAHRS